VQKWATPALQCFVRLILYKAASKQSCYSAYCMMALQCFVLLVLYEAASKQSCIVACSAAAVLVARWLCSDLYLFVRICLAELQCILHTGFCSARCTLALQCFVFICTNLLAKAELQCILQADLAVLLITSSAAVQAARWLCSALYLFVRICLQKQSCSAYCKLTWQCCL
jgi:hypothetical protein